MMRVATIVAAAIALSACRAGPVETAPPAKACDAARLTDLIGRPATADLARTARRRLRVSVIRVLRPGDMATMDYREDRLNIAVDARNIVTGLRCG